jgi:hypothetical protein
MDTFNAFIKFLYYDESALKSLGDSLSIDQTVYLLECHDFYGLSNDRFKLLVERKMQ